jgi:hypothetical protein
MRSRSVFLLMALVLCAATLSAADNPDNGRASNVRAAKPMRPVGDAFRAIDVNGQLVGYNVNGNYFARMIDGIWVSFPISPLGFDNPFASPEGNSATALYATTDCSGAAYKWSDIFHSGSVVGTTLYYAQEPIAPITVQSQRLFDEAHPAGGACNAGGSFSIPAGTMATFDLSTLNLTPPFHVTQ